MDGLHRIFTFLVRFTFQMICFFFLIHSVIEIREILFIIYKLGENQYIRVILHNPLFLNFQD